VIAEVEGEMSAAGSGNCHGCSLANNMAGGGGGEKTLFLRNFFLRGGKDKRGGKICFNFL